MNKPIEDESKKFPALKQLLDLADSHKNDNKKIVVVQGLGFVGTAVAAVIADAKNSLGEDLYFVICVEADSKSGQEKVYKLNRGISPVISSDTNLDRIINDCVIEKQNLLATVVEEAYNFADFIIVDVGLDVQEIDVDHIDQIDVDLSGFENAIRVIGKQMPPEALILIETTVPVGLCEKIALPIILEERASRNIKDLPNLAYCYERVMPGPQYIESIRNNWRTLAGFNKESTIVARQFLESFIQTDEFPLFELDDLASAEMGKLIENSYRAVNIAFIYEWTLFAEKVGVNLFEILNSIRVRKGTHDNIRYPGFGVGGYCLPKDALLAQWSANNIFGGQISLDITMHALNTNNKMPLHTFDLVSELVGGKFKGKKILICGVSYAADVSDTRNSPTAILVDKLIEFGAEVQVHDSYVKDWIERPMVPISQNIKDCLMDIDGLVLAVSHKEYMDLNINYLVDNCTPNVFLVDAQNLLTDVNAELLHQSGFRLSGVGKGHWRKRGFHCTN